MMSHDSNAHLDEDEVKRRHIPTRTTVRSAVLQCHSVLLVALLTTGCCQGASTSDAIDRSPQTSLPADEDLVQFVLKHVARLQLLAGATDIEDFKTKYSIHSERG